MSRADKLVRDRIPDIIRVSGRRCETRTLAEKEYALALSEKLLEEAWEVVEADAEGMLEELADLYEVVDAVATLYGFDADEVRRVQAAKRERCGGFNARVFLESFEAPVLDGVQ